ncbi:MAG: hypothetical protein K2P31_01625 [Rickettsiaceae bacterium]|nr:hypothetical protein [Rickettsiaceae bacterium]
MSKDTSRILEKIKALEEEKARLLPLRIEEIVNVLQSNGGLTLDNRLLAGLAIYANNPVNATSGLLMELMKLGQTRIPSSKLPGNKLRGGSKSSNTNTALQSVAVKEEKAYG